MLWLNWAPMQSVVSTGVRFFSLLLWPNWGWVCWWSFCPCYCDQTDLPVKGRACCWREGLGGRGRRGQNMPCSHFRTAGLCALCSTQVFFYNQNICTLNVGFRIFTNIWAQQARVKIALVQDNLCAGLQYRHPRVTSCSPRFPRFPAPWFLSYIPRYGRNRWSQ